MRNNLRWPLWRMVSLSSLPLLEENRGLEPPVVSADCIVLKESGNESPVLERRPSLVFNSATILPSSSTAEHTQTPIFN